MGGMPVDATWDQDSFRFYDDDASPDSATPLAGLNTVPSDIALDTNFLLRFVVQETAGSNSAETPRFHLEYRSNDGGGFDVWTDVNNSASNTTPVKVSASSNFTDNVTLTQVDGSGTFRDGSAEESTDDLPSSTGNLAATNGSDEYELVWSLLFNSSASTPAGAGDIFEFRLRITDGNLNTEALFTDNGGTYTNIPSVTASAGGAISVVATAGTYAVSGVAANLEYGFVVDATAGSYAVTGVDAGLAIGINVAADVGSYAVSGVDAGFLYGYSVEATAGSYAVSGVDANLEYGYVVTADVGSYSVTGVDATLTKVLDRTVVATAGTYAVSGVDANLEYGFVLDATTPGSYAVTGVDANLEYGFVVAATAGSYDVSGVDVGFVYDYAVQADAGSYVITGVDANLEYGYVVAADAGSYTVNGVDATLTVAADKTVAADAGVYTVSGVDANLEYGYVVDANAGSYAVSGVDANLEYGYLLAAEAGSYAITGVDGNLEFGYLVTADAGSYAVTGVDAGLLLSGDIILDAQAGSYEITGADVDLTYTPITGTTPPRGIGGWVADMAAADRARDKFDETQRRRERELRDIIERAVLGEREAHPKVAAKPLSQTARKRVAKQVRIDVDTSGIDAGLAEIERLIIELMSARKTRRDEEAIAILLMAI